MFTPVAEEYPFAMVSVDPKTHGDEGTAWMSDAGCSPIAWLVWDGFITPALFCIVLAEISLAAAGELPG